MPAPFADKCILSKGCKAPSKEFQRKYKESGPKENGLKENGPKDDRDVAYAMVRSLVLQFEKREQLKSQANGARVKYTVCRHAGPA